MTVWATRADQVDLRSPNPHDLARSRFLRVVDSEEIALLKAQGLGVRGIARRLGRDPSTISRELRRNAATRGGRLDYRASVAQWKAELLAERPKTAKLAANDQLREYVQDRLAGRANTGWDIGPRADAGGVEGPEQGPPSGPALGDLVESAADRQPVAHRLPGR